MPNYNLLALNDKEFEILAVDIIGVINGVKIERFKSGKDGGVDGRWFSNDQSEIIVQCKHWLKSGIDALIRKLKFDEITKVRILNPKRYILVTSLELSRVNKKKIFELMSPFIVSESDILGSEDINDFVAKNPEIELRHYKLWLTSATSIGYIVNNAILGRSRFAESEIREKLPIYVKTIDYEEASKILAEKNTVILTGEPGIGKTTLAAQLAIEYLAKGYSLVYIQDELSEAESVYSNNKQVFFYDDFLGQNFLEALKAKKDAHIIGFIKRVAKDGNKKFILTSRTSILNQGRILTELFDRENINKNEYQLSVGNLKRVEKAKILYSHIWHSRISEELVEELYKEKRYIKIVDHFNFNPRLISFILDVEKIETDPKKYWGYVLGMLDFPAAIWGHFFDRQLDGPTRDLTALVVYNGNKIDEESLRAAFFKLKSDLDPGDVDRVFKTSIKVAANSVINRTLSDKNQVGYVLYNPSIADFVLKEIKHIEHIQKCFSSLRTINALKTIYQIKLNKIFDSNNLKILINHLSELEIKSEIKSDNYIVYLAGQFGYEFDLQSLTKKALSDIPPNSYVGHVESYLSLFDNAISWNLIDDPQVLFSELVVAMGEWEIDKDHIETLHRISESIDFQQHNESLVNIREMTIEFWENYIGEYVVEYQVLEDFMDVEQEAEARDILRDEICKNLRMVGMDLDIEAQNRILRSVDISSIIDDNATAASREGDRPSRWGDSNAGRGREDVEIDDLFDRDR